MKPALRKLISAMLFIAALNITAYAQDGSLDATFGSGGKVTTNVNGLSDRVSSMILQPGGKITLVGTTTQNSYAFHAIARFTTGGKLDSSFGVNGKVITDTVPLDGFIGSALQSNNKIIITNGKYNPFSLIRLTAAGVVDSTFGINGRASITPFGDYAYCNAIAVQSNDYIVLAGTYNCDIVMARFKPDGTVDSTFGVNGKKVIDAGGCERANALVIQPDQKIVIAGGRQDGPNGLFLVSRLKPNGEIDSAFGTDGITTINIRTYNEAFACALQKDGKIVLGGQASYISLRPFGIARVNADGKIDSSFATNGAAYTEVTGTNVPKALAVQEDGKIIFVGENNNGGNNQTAVLRYRTNGTLDTTFSSDKSGKVIVSVAELTNGKAVAIQKDGKIVIGCEAVTIPSYNSDFCLVRLLSFNPLPVQLTAFTGQIVKTGVELTWNTATEVNSSHFVIERSNGNSFNAIGRISSGGNSSQVQQYSYTDVQPLTGENFYRLKQVDKDGRFAYSKIVRIIFGSDAPYLVAYPNPAKTTVKVGGLTAGAYLTVVNASGKVISQYRSAGSNYSLNIQNLNAGVYFICVQQNGKTNTLKVVKE